MLIFLIGIILGVILFKLGVLSILVVVLKISLFAVIGCVAGAGLVMIYLNHRKL